MIDKHPVLLKVHPADTVAVALCLLEAGQQVLGITAASAVPQGHKVALVHHQSGDSVFKYGQPIGTASAAIAPGEHVHSHNLATALSGELVYAAIASGDACAAERAGQRSIAIWKRGVTL